jgi:phosphopantothenoylcysteine decarboxylase/phosphopantothenate--cysteine ligase
MPEPEEIMSHVGRLLETDSILQGKQIVVTAGATREPIDPVRFISNHSSGKMGVALARAAWRRGAEVTLIAGHVDVAIPREIRTVKAETVGEMARSVGDALPAADVLIMAAAPADFRPTSEAPQKIKKGKGAPLIALEATEDILASTMSKRKKKSVIVGFALETTDGVNNAREKLKAKNLDLVVLNNAREPGAGFGVDTNRVTVIRRNGEQEELELMTKTDLADVLLDRIAEELRGRYDFAPALPGAATRARRIGAGARQPARRRRHAAARRGRHGTASRRQIATESQRDRDRGSRRREQGLARLAA